MGMPPRLPMGTGSRPPTAGHILLPSGQPRNIAQTARMTSFRAHATDPTCGHMALPEWELTRHLTLIK